MSEEKTCDGDCERCGDGCGCGSSCGCRSTVPRDPVTREELQEFAERNWLRVDAAQRDRCVWHLRETLHRRDLVHLREGFERGFEPGFHMFGGMGIRNLLRDVVRDDQLPLVQYSDGSAHRNWDDFYMAALRQAVAPREGEV